MYIKATKTTGTHKTIAFGSPRVLIRDDDCFEYVSKLLKVATHGLALRLPRQSPNEDLGESSVPKWGIEELETRV